MTINLISFVTQSNRGITHVGGLSWKKTAAEVIRLIEAKQERFFASGGFCEVLVDGKSIRAHADGTLNNNLLMLPDFPPPGSVPRLRMAGVR